MTKTKADCEAMVKGLIMESEQIRDDDKLEKDVRAMLSTTLSGIANLKETADTDHWAVLYICINHGNVATQWLRERRRTLRRIAAMSLA